MRVDARALRIPFLKAFALLALLALLAAVCAWWVVLTSDSRRMAQDESERQTALLLQEIDAHRRTDAALQAAKERAESASVAKTRYVAGMTHELRTPLNSILGYAQILLKDPAVRGTLREALSIMQQSGQHMHALIDGSLELARIEAGRLRLDPVPLPLSALLEEVRHMVQPQADAKGLAFSLVVEGTAPAWIRVDGKRLRQILLNLLSNAVRFTRAGQVQLRLDFRRHVARIEVKDSGVGIAPQDIDRIFLPFERGSLGRHNRESGTGLGLTITHLLTELMGGELSVRSTPGQGSIFTVRLYLPGVPDGALQQANTEAVKLRPVTGYRPPLRTLLVVDDQPLHRQLLAGFLVPLGFEVWEAASGSECLEAVRRAPPDMILLDLSLDEMNVNGWQIAGRLRRIYDASDLPIVFVSANLFDNNPERIKALNCQGFVSKPVIESALLDALQRALSLSWVYADTLASERPIPGCGPLATRSDDASATVVSTHGRSAQAPPERADTTLSRLPVLLREDVLRLARQGNAVLLKQRLRDAALTLPEHADSIALLSAYCDQFDFAALATHLRNTGHDADSPC